MTPLWRLPLEVNPFLAWTDCSGCYCFWSSLISRILSCAYISRRILWELSWRSRCYCLHFLKTANPRPEFCLSIEWWGNQGSNELAMPQKRKKRHTPWALEKLEKLEELLFCNGTFLAVLDPYIWSAGSSWWSFHKVTHVEVPAYACSAEGVPFCMLAAQEHQVKFRYRDPIEVQ